MPKLPPSRRYLIGLCSERGEAAHVSTIGQLMKGVNPGGRRKLQRGLPATVGFVRHSPGGRVLGRGVGGSAGGHRGISGRVGLRPSTAVGHRLGAPVRVGCATRPYRRTTDDRRQLHHHSGHDIAGLAPLTRQSRTWTGRACVRDGHARLRNALFMPALVAVMRKLVLLANALLRSNRNWTRELA